MRGTCEYHKSAPVEAETVRETPKATYVALRCTECGRTRGVRRTTR